MEKKILMPTTEAKFAVIGIHKQTGNPILIGVYALEETAKAKAEQIVGEIRGLYEKIEEIKFNNIPLTPKEKGITNAQEYAKYQKEVQDTVETAINEFIKSQNVAENFPYLPYSIFLLKEGQMPQIQPQTQG